MSGNDGQWRLLFRNQGDPDYLDLTPTPSGPFLEAPPSGLDLADTQTTDSSTVQRDGREMYTDTYGPRAIEFAITYPNESCSECDSRRDVAEVMARWARTCPSSELIISTDCTDPNIPVLESISNDPVERSLLGPYIVRGRPRRAPVTHGRSDTGLSRIEFQFQGDDHRIGVLQPDPINGEPSEIQCLELSPDGTPQDAANHGDTYVYPEIRLVGPLTGPVQVFRSGADDTPIVYDASVTDSVLIDTERRKAWLADGTDVSLGVTWGWRRVAARLGFDSLVWVETGDAGDAGHVEYCYGTYVRGI